MVWYFLLHLCTFCIAMLMRKYKSVCLKITPAQKVNQSQHWTLHGHNNNGRFIGCLHPYKFFYFSPQQGIRSVASPFFLELHSSCLNTTAPPLPVQLDFFPSSLKSRRLKYNCSFTAADYTNKHFHTTSFTSSITIYKKETCLPARTKNKFSK